MSSGARSLDFSFSDSDFHRIAGFAYEKFGLNLEIHKKDLVYGRLAKRLRRLGLADFDRYFEVLFGAGGSREQNELLSLLTTNVTHFFRESHHFEALKKDVLPVLLERAKKGHRVRMWSAGCSAGHEAYSLALLVCDLCPDAASYDLRILATDVDPKILAVGRRATYTESDLKGIPAALRSRGTAPTADGSFQISDHVKKLVTFGELNLVKEWPIRGKFDVVFCRNVAIYFDKQTQERLWSRLADVLPAGGHLMVGHSERITGPASNTLENHGVTSYIKRASK